MNLSQLKQIYMEKHNINAVNQIVEIEDIQNKTNLSPNKIIQYLSANCTSKNNRKILNLLEFYFPPKSELSLDDINKIVNRNFLSQKQKEINENNLNKNSNKETEKTEIKTEIKIVKYKTFKNINKSQKTK